MSGARRWWALTLALALAGCPEPDGGDDDTTEPSGTECEDGYVDDGGTCVPEACGVGTWGDLALPDDAVYVHASAADGGDGGEDAPRATIQGGLDRAAEGAAELLVEDSTIADHPLAAVWLDGPGSYALTGNDLEGGWGAAYQYPDGETLMFHGNAVYATDRIEPWDPQLETGLLLDGNLLHDGAGAAVMLHGASATLQDNDYDGNLVDLQQQACGEVPIPEGHEEAPAAVLCPQYDAPVEQLRFLLQHAEAAPQE